MKISCHLKAFLLALVARRVVTSDLEDCVHCPEYVDSTAEEKEANIYSKIVATEYPLDNLREFGDLCESYESLETDDVDFSNMFDRFSDERPADFKRFFHFSGIVAKVKFESTPGHNFTGVFQGADHGVLRFSPLAPMMRDDYLTNYFIGSFLFSFGLKLFRDGMHSGNFVVGDTPKGLNRLRSSRSGIWTKPDWNIFSRPLHNFAGIGDDLDPFFGAQERFSGVLSVADIAAYDQQGNEEKNPFSPIIVQFNPNEGLKNKFGKGPSKDFRRWATTEDAVPVGTALYSAWTTINKETKEPSLCVNGDGLPQLEPEDVSRDCPEQELLKLGDVVTKSRFHTSSWVDDYLFFQHTRVCPKNQKKCEISGTTPSLTIPAPIFSSDTSDFCLSDESGKDELEPGSVACPQGTTFVKDTCFPGEENKVKETQQSQCPFMSRINRAILTNVENPRSTSCTWFARFFRNRLLNSGLGGFSIFMRVFEGLFSFFF